MTWLRDLSDEWAVRERLRAHLCLTTSSVTLKSFRIVCMDKKLCDLVRDSLSYLPHPLFSKARLKVHVRPDTHILHPSWFGCQSGNRIELYSPAYRNVTTLVFTLFHECGHWLAQSTHNDPNSEDFANSFAWFCVNPTYYKIKNPKQFARFEAALVYRRLILDSQSYPNAMARIRKVSMAEATYR
ncbi:MAG: hypothetical protein HY537_16885 [Deltaproteobacteria bacterium]|nr:hypothetical protein [Deltaproteobacteria bacterium]